LAEHRRHQHIAADAPAAVGDLVDEDERVRPGPFAVDLGVEVGDGGDEPLLSAAVRVRPGP
jgi:hypothetical protein